MAIIPTPKPTPTGAIGAMGAQGATGLQHAAPYPVARTPYPYIISPPYIAITYTELTSIRIRYP